MSKHELEGFIRPFTFFRFIRYFKIRALYSLGRSVRGLKFQRHDQKDLFSQLVADVISNKDRNLLSQQLYDYYQTYSHLSSADVVTLPGNNYLSQYPEWALVLPWENQRIEDKFRKYSDYFIDNRSTHGLKIDSNIHNSDISETFYSFSGACSQIEQTYKLYQSFSRYGIIQKRNVPIIDILVDKSQWRWMMSCSGNHRCYLIFNMGYSVLESRIGTIVKKCNSKYWPNVKNGLYSVDEAEYLFDLVFEGNTPIRGIV